MRASRSSSSLMMPRITVVLKIMPGLCMRKFMLPTRRFMKCASPIREHVRELTIAQHPLPNLLKEGGGLLEHKGGVSLRVEDTDFLVQSFADNVYGCQQVGVIGDNDGHIKEVLIRVTHQVCR